ncbi:hypothetical protein [Actinoplanes utahensis]|uniref:ABM domain-containing protein n=1 Tax=Actinoplanes utahensis TaxID=1869 RepID=A0A0A6UPQ9_ACTUT|nr:hypothetical protein [Actinoplanes utahensis]KHD77431.1 hypothetical protein MB27_11215 [Actinoplanes utahensis]GIF32935.1 hypothetical protein Aut01nite_59210 [Actinoplanes utahensis]
MTTVRTHTYMVEPADLEEFLARRASLIGTVREAHPGLTATVLIRLDDETYTDTWHWASGPQMQAALAAIGGFPEAPLAMALTKDRTTRDGLVVDQR